MNERPVSNWAIRARAGAAGVAALLLLLLVGCGGGGDKGEATATTVEGASTTVAPAGSGKPCDLVTQAEVEAAVGAPVKAGGSAGTPQGTACSFSLASNGAEVILVLKSTDQGNVANYDKIKKGSTGAKDLSGLGDKAFVAGGQAVVLKGTSLYVVTLSLDRPPAELADASTNLVKAAVS
ncbi:MAG: hypothetical protein QOJ69_1981 [Actinomycetota bacterium]|nr:hypothetical protein [Actinomycetota bacterium]